MSVITSTFRLSYILFTFILCHLSYASDILDVNQNKNDILEPTSTKPRHRNVFVGQNPIFQNNKHMIFMSYGSSLRPGDRLHLVSKQYSVPNKFLVNGRETIEIGGFIGTVKPSHTDVSQFYVGLMHEFVMDLKYFYATAGIGIYVRSTDSTFNEADRIGSAFTFGEKFAIGKTFGSFNIEIMYRHFSNAGLTSKNNGYDMFGIGIGWRF